MWWLMLATALAQSPLDERVPELPPPDHARLNSYHSDPLLLPHLDFSMLGGVDNTGAATGYALIEIRLGGTFAFGVGGSDRVLDIGPTLNWNWRLFSLQHLWNLDIILRTPLLSAQATQLGLGGDLSPAKNGRVSVRVRGFAGNTGLAGELGLVVRAL